MEEVTILNRHTSFDKTEKPAIIRIDTSVHNARISISVEAVKLLKLKPGNGLVFIVLKKDPESIYFYVDDKDGIPLRKENSWKSGISLCINCRPVARKLLNHFRFNGTKSFVITAGKVECQAKKCFVIDKFKSYSGKYKPNGRKL